MMLDHPGDADAAAVEAIENVLSKGPHTPDLGGRSGIEEVGKAVAAAI